MELNVEDLRSLICHGVLFLNLGLLLVILSKWTSHRFLITSHEKSNFYVLIWTVLLLKCLFVMAAMFLIPHYGIYQDSLRYYTEAMMISDRPWLWNPLEGTGFYYADSAKMGLSYLYGIIQFFHGTRSLVACYAFNIVLGMFTCFITFGLTKLLTKSNGASILAFAICGLYPETIYWSARVLRENLSIPLVAALVLFSCLYAEKRKWNHGIVVGLLLFALLVTRAQLIFFAILIGTFYLLVFVYGLIKQRKIMTALYLAIGCLAVMFIFYLSVEDQIRKGFGSIIFDLINLQSAVWNEKLESLSTNIMSVLTPVARAKHGPLGYLVAPIFLLVFILFILLLLNLRRIYSKNIRAARLYIYLIVTYIAALTVTGYVNIRFRSTVAPLVIALLAGAIVYTWKRLKLPPVYLIRFNRNS